MDQREFRTALSSFATGVTVVTASGENGAVGMTASSFNSVSMDPPLVLWSVAKTTPSAEQFRVADHYAIHVMGAEQQALVMQFATPGIDKFNGVDYHTDAHGVPVLDQCVVRFDCRQWAVYEGGDHWIIVGEVLDLHKNNAESLVFCEGTFATINPIRSSDRVEQSPGEEDSPVDHLLLYNLARAYRQMSRQFHAGVRDSGLSIPQWRILASLYGGVSRQFEDLQQRTFLDSEALHDALVVLERDGLCRIEGNGTQAAGTDSGHERVRHLFDLGRAQELRATDENTLALLIQHLSEVVKNTSEL
ncbi:MAG: flavin reductase [Pseudomonadota bacterium]